jgi:hypothetical protein
MCNRNPTQFWDYIKKLGPRNIKKNIPDEVFKKETLITQKSDLLETWRSEFYTLLNGNEVTGTKYEHYINHKILLEQKINDPLYESNINMNANIMPHEVDKAIQKAKFHKAVGPDLIPYEALKNDRMKMVLIQLFQLCFDSGKLPSEWLKSNILPIPKSSAVDPRIPLNYRGISLLSSIYKIYSSILNVRLL